MAPSDATEKNRNIGAQLQSILYTTAKKILENLLPVGLLVSTNLFIPSRFLDYQYELRHLLSALGSDVYSLGPKLLQ